MKPNLHLALFGAILLAGCDTGTQASTSSETQTALQELADNAGAIASRIPAPEKSTNVAARRMDNSTYSVWAIMDSSFCAGWTTHSYTGFGRISVDSASRATGPDGTYSTCSLLDFKHNFRQFRLDSIGRSDLRGTLHQVDTFTQFYEGSGTWDLRTGLSLTYLQLQAYLGTKLDTFHQVIQFHGNCQVDLRMVDSLTDTGEFLSGADAPVVCNGRTVGRFLWDQIGPPHVVDAENKIVSPRASRSIAFPEDAYGLDTTFLRIVVDSADSTAALQTHLRWKLLPGDTIAPGDSVSLALFNTPYDSVKPITKAEDTLTFRIPSSILRSPDLIGTASISVRLHNGYASTVNFALPH